MRLPYSKKQIQTSSCISMLGLLLSFVIPLAQADIGTQPQALRTYVYECDAGFNFIVNFKNDKAWVFLPMQTVALDSVPSGSGSKYSNGAITYWSKGDEAILETPNRQYRNCKNNRAKAIWEDAKLRGVDFRALGNEPGWYLEISEKTKLKFVSNYGQSRYEFTLAAPVTDQAARMTSYTATDGRHSVTVVIEGRVCYDTMSGENFESTVLVRFNNEEYRGCGRALH
jgi:membrane-bound inhibitor of C-type lysozyme